MASLGDYRLYKGCLEFYGDLYKAEKVNFDELEKMRREVKALLIKHVYDFDCDQETSYWYIIQDNFFDLLDYPSNTRKQIRKSLSVYKYRKVNPEEMYLNGYKVYCAASLRRGIAIPEMDKKTFSLYIDSNYKRGVEYWMGYEIESGEAAMWEAVLVQKYCVVEEVEKLSIYYTKHNPTYGLNYELMRYYIKEHGFKYIIAGARTLQERSNVQDFLISKMKFRRAYCRLQCCYDWKVNFLYFLLYPFQNVISNSKLRILFGLKKYSK